jgi:hypothetical protein
MQNQKMTDSDAAEIARQVTELHQYIKDEFERVNLRIDHVYGNHDFSRQVGCPSCDRKYGVQE